MALAKKPALFRPEDWAPTVVNVVIYSLYWLVMVKIKNQHVKYFDKEQQGWADNHVPTQTAGKKVKRHATDDEHKRGVQVS